MIIHSKKYLPEPSGVWLFDHDTGELEYLDTHKDSSVYTEWPIMNRHETLHMARGVDSLLNAAASGKKDKLDRSLRARWAGDKLGLLVDTPMQSDFWYRHAAAFGSLGAQRRMFLGSGTEGSQLGFVIDDSKDNTSVTGWTGAVETNYGGSNGFPGLPGNGPGRGGRTRYPKVGGGGGGYSEEGTKGSVTYSNDTGSGPGGIIIPPEWSYAALFMNSFTRENLAIGGSGSSGGSSDDFRNHGGAGGDAGGGIARLKVNNLSESTNRTLTGNDGSDGSDYSTGTHGASGGAGSGGLYIAIIAGSYTLESSITIDCNGGTGGTVGNDGGAGGDGRVILLFGNSVTISGTISNAETSKKQMIRGLPRGGSLYY